MKAAYVVNFVLRQSNVQIGFVFEVFKNADELYRRGVAELNDVCSHSTTREPHSSTIEITDDFDSRANIDMSDVVCVVFNDIEKETKKNVAMRIDGDLLYSKAVQAAQRTPTLATPAANGLKV